jgi:GTP-binding protein
MSGLRRQPARPLALPNLVNRASSGGYNWNSSSSPMWVSWVIPMRVNQSTLLRRVSAARPKVADYPFTTLVPYLGVVSYGDLKSFVMADIPGLIAGAHQGAGLGSRFLRHIERTSLLVHLVDIAADPEGDPWRPYEEINEELGKFHVSLLEKPQVVVLNKIDLPHVRERIPQARATFRQKGVDLFTISAWTGEGVDDLIRAIGRQWEKIRGATHG